jgi:hypothetical protein
VAQKYFNVAACSEVAQIFAFQCDETVAQPLAGKINFHVDHHI